LAAGELGEGLFPDAAELDFDFEAVHEVLPLGRLELGEVAGEELGEDATKVAMEVVKNEWLNNSIGLTRSPSPMWS
jgi:hypothetical protein